MADRIDMFHAFAAAHLTSIRRALKADARLTLVVRFPGEGLDTGMVVTADDLRLVIEQIEHRMASDETEVRGG